MSLIKWQKDESLFPSLIDDFFGKDYFNSITTGTTVPAVNIKDEADFLKIDLAAPGLKKEDFKIILDHNVLTISSEKKEEKEEKEGKFMRREYSFHSFSRSFTIPDNTDSEKINASYKDGVLSIAIPKKKDVPSNMKQINIK